MKIGNDPAATLQWRQGTSDEMRREPEFFGEHELNLIYVAKRLNDALRLEELLNGAGFDYLVEPDKYLGGIVFQSERVGAFFYVAPHDDAAAREAMQRGRFRPQPPESSK